MNIKETGREVIYSVLSITIFVIILQFTLVNLPSSIFIRFIGGSIMVMLGLILFMIGAKTAFIPMGELIGSALVQKGKLWLIILFGFILGFAVTIADPDVQILANQVSIITSGEIARTVLIITVSIGLGIFYAIAFARIFIDIPIKYFFVMGYTIAFIVGFFAPSEYFAVSFDAGGVTTGPMIVLFLVAMGVGVTSVTSKKGASENSFGLLGLSCIGPIIALLLLGVIKQ